jgi:hypothetical protein
MLKILKYTVYFLFLAGLGIFWAALSMAGGSTRPPS